MCPYTSEHSTLLLDTCVLYLPIFAGGTQHAEFHRRGATLSLATATPRHGTWTPAPLSAHLSTEWECTASQIDTPICSRHTTAHQFN